MNNRVLWKDSHRDRHRPVAGILPLVDLHGIAPHGPAHRAQGGSPFGAFRPSYAVLRWVPHLSLIHI
eukprot:2740782-Alexandrium_andersonii.AAC.1